MKRKTDRYNRIKKAGRALLASRCYVARKRCSLYTLFNQKQLGMSISRGKRAYAELIGGEGSKIAIYVASRSWLAVST